MCSDLGISTPIHGVPVAQAVTRPSPSPKSASSGIEYPSPTITASLETRGGRDPLDAVEEPQRGSAARLVREVAATAEQASLLRVTVSSWALVRGLPAELAADLELAVYEALTNVVEHAYPRGTTGAMTVNAAVEPRALVVTVADGGRWSDDSDREGLRGRGLPLIRVLAPEAAVTTTSTGTIVRMAWPWPPT
ncbi:ATP-binding protein [Amycolatopsis lexingtonensis]|uniref:ATP-binding protein n=1 Tax=Amycolatopsis lexingtonensis TaxID=218822 RepID=UPI003F6FD533